MPPPQRQDPDAKREQIMDLTFPTYGIDLSQEFDLQRPATTPVAINVRGYEPQTQRDRGGSRPGLSKYNPEQLDPVIGDMQIQDLNVLVLTGGTALLTNFSLDLFNTGGFTVNPLNPLYFVPIYGSGIQLNGFTGSPAPIPGGTANAGSTTGTGSGSAFPATLIGGSNVNVNVISGSGTLPSGTGFIAIQLGTTYYIQPPTFTS
jgi:hypothetical protein